MMLTKKSTGAHGTRAHTSLVHSLQRGLSAALPTMDLAAFCAAPAWVSGSVWPPRNWRW